MPSEKDLYRISLKVFLINKEGECLVLKCKNDGMFAGFWDTPGGSIDKEEFATPFETTINREIAEEIGEIDFDLNLRPVGMGRFQNPNKESPLGGPLKALCLFFEATYKGGEIKISEEHTGFKWAKLTKENIENLFILANLEGAKMYLENEDNHKS
ncbi:MAG: NUDIX domain-containing protein [Patescibacteria group bacterium]